MNLYGTSLLSFYGSPAVPVSRLIQFSTLEFVNLECCILNSAMAPLAYWQLGASCRAYHAIHKHRLGSCMCHMVIILLCHYDVM